MPSHFQFNAVLLAALHYTNAICFFISYKNIIFSFMLTFSGIKQGLGVMPHFTA
jgi:hypothetical protein